MAAPPQELTEAPAKRPSASPLDDILSSLRLTGGVVVDAQAHGDWCMVSQFSPEHCGAYFPVPATLIGYHYVCSGELWAEVEGYPKVHLREGSVLVLPRNDRHLLYSRPGLAPIDADDLLKPGVNGGPATVRIDGEGAVAHFYCGFLGVGDDKHPLMDALPPLVVLEPEDLASSWIGSSMQFLSCDQSPEMVARLAELFVAHAIRRYLESGSGSEAGWIAGLKDPSVARALEVIHRRYAEQLDINTLARESGASRSLLGKRFLELLGEPPMRYCARWRMRMAANMLRNGEAKSANIAYAVGFNSEAAFNRAFKREFGEPPATWKRRRAV